LTRGFVTLVDEADWPVVSAHTWCVFNANTKWPYAVSGSAGCHKGKLVLHRFLLDAPAVLYVDHVNGDTLDNRRQNLRLVTPSDNHANQRAFGVTSRYRGVTYHAGKWLARVRARGRELYLGRFVEEEDAARAVDTALRAVWGEHARLNFPDLVHDQLG
jgi:hypothetical protein